MGKLIDSFMSAIEKSNAPAVARATRILKKVFKEDVDGDVTSADKIADVRARLPMKKKIKKAKIGYMGDGPTHDGGCKRSPVEEPVSEDASTGATNAADFSNDFGTDTPRLPTELGSLDGNKSMGMWGGTDVITMTMFNAFIKADRKPKPMHKALNHDFEKRAGASDSGDSTIKDPVKISPWDSYVPSQEFITKSQTVDKVKVRAGIAREQMRRDRAKELTALVKKAFIDSLDNKLNPDVHKSKVAKVLAQYADIGKVGKDEKKDHEETDPTKPTVDKEMKGDNYKDVKPNRGSK